MGLAERADVTLYDAVVIVCTEDNRWPDCMKVDSSDSRKVWDYFRPTVDLALCQRIIEREKISVMYSNGTWCAYNNNKAAQFGDTMVKAALLCYISSSLGNVVAVPEPIKTLKYED